MPTPQFATTALERIRGLRSPQDYFAETRSGPVLWPEKILCFARRSRAETARDVLARHHHHRYVLVVPWQGTGAVYADDRRFALGPLHSLLIFPFQFHHGFDFNQESVVWQIITFEMKGGATLEGLRLHPARQMKESDYELMRGLVEAWESKRDNELSQWLGLFLSRMLTSRPVGQTREKKRSKPSSLLMRINQHCMPRLDEAIGLKELAGRMAISESYLRARFRQETGMSLGQHLRRLRLQKAMSLLLQSELSISQIAERCGFDSIFAFSRSFHRFSGMRASNYRERFAKG